MADNETDVDPKTPPDGKDTATGIDPNAKYDGPGWEDKSLGQAVSQDEELVEDLLDEHDGDVDAAEDEFEERSVGAPVRAEQGRPETA